MAEVLDQFLKCQPHRKGERKLIPSAVFLPRPLHLHELAKQPGTMVQAVFAEKKTLYSRDFADIFKFMEQASTSL
jgi:hypothetical protein